MLGGFHFDYIYDVAGEINAQIQLVQAAAAHISIVVNELPFDNEQIIKAFRDIFQVKIENSLKLVTIKNPTRAEIDHYRKLDEDLVLENKSPGLIQWLFKV
jgi:aspartate kinase